MNLFEEVLLEWGVCCCCCSNFDDDVVEVVDEDIGDDVSFLQYKRVEHI